MEELSVPNFRRNVKEKRFYNPMHAAVIKGDIEAIETQVKSGEKISKEENGQTPLHLAVIKGKTLAVRKLISLGSNLNQTNKDGFAPLHLAVTHDRVSLIEDLINISTECDVDILDRNGNTALHTAVLMDNEKAVRALLIEGANADLPNKEKNAPLHLAAIQGNQKVIDVLIKYVRKPNILDKHKFRPLHLAVLYNQIYAIRKIGKLKDTKINNHNGNGDSALHLATKLRNLEAIEALLDSGANPNLGNTRNLSALHLAIIFRNFSTTEVLTRIDRANQFKNTPIHVAEPREDIPALNLLCRSRANVNLKNISGDTILHSLIETDCANVVKRLLDLGAKPNIRNSCSGLTPLHLAACFGNNGIINMLLKYGAEIHILDCNGDMPIHLAARFCSFVGIKGLWKRRSNLCLENTSGLTPLDIVMPYVKEDAFGTAVQTLTDVFNKKNLKRRSPLSSHEILKCARLVLKFELLQNFEQSKMIQPGYLSNIISIVRAFINNCLAEVRLMKSTLLHENFPFYEFVTKGWIKTMPLTREYTSQVALNHILDVSNTKGYPIYRGLIVSCLDRPALLRKVMCLKIFALQDGKTIFLDMDAVPKYLNNQDILNLILASSDLFPDRSDSESSNFKKRQLAES